MAISEGYSGTQTVDTTEWSMTSDTAGPDAETADGVYQAFVDLTNLASGDRYEFRVYEKVLSTSTQRLVYREVFDGAQDAPVYPSVPLTLIHGWDMCLVKIAGSDRSLDWSIRKIA